MNQIDLNQLKHFYWVAKSSGFTRAAHAYRAQQPALSRSVRQLETDLGVILFERHKRNVKLTAIGQKVFESCARLFQETENIRALVAAESSTCQGPLKIATASVISSHLLPKVNARFLKAHPDVWPMIYSGPTNQSLIKVEQADLDFGLFFYLQIGRASCRERV